MATELLGMQQMDRGGKIRAFRMDDRTQRLVVDGNSDSGLPVMGRGVANRKIMLSVAI